MAKNPVLRVYRDDVADLRFKVEGGLHYFKSNSKPYFSLTANGWDRGSEFGGCCHDVILKRFPDLADFAALHLSDIDGNPTYADANGWYNLAGYFDGAGERYHVGNSERHFPCVAPADKPWKTTEFRKPTKDECLAIWAEYLRIPVAQAKIAADDIARVWNWPDMKAAHKVFVEAQHPRWKAEAEACIAKHGLRVYGDPWPAGEAVV